MEDKVWSNKCFVPLKTRAFYQLAQLRLGEGKVPDVKVLQDVVLEMKKKPCQQHTKEREDNKSGSNCNCNDVKHTNSSNTSNNYSSSGNYKNNSSNKKISSPP